MRSVGASCARAPVLFLAGVIGAGLASGCAAPEPAPAPAPSDSAVTDAAAIAFADVTIATGLAGFRHHTGDSGKRWFPEIAGGGGGFIDYNGDERLDLVLVSGGTWEGEQPPALRLFRNEGDSTFADVTEAAKLSASSAYGMGVTVADYDNDGDPDLYLTALRKNLLFRNEGDGTFAEVAQGAGVAGPPRWSTAAVFFDADRDGWLDLYVGGYVRWSPEEDLWCSVDGKIKSYCTPEAYEGTAPHFYHNNGDGTFSEQTGTAGFTPAPGKTLGAATLDYNKDGWPDLAVANDMNPDLLYENNGDGTFTERGMVSGIAFNGDGKARAGMGIDVGVVDTTGEPTIVVGNFSNEVIGVYRHAAEGLFVDRSAISGIGAPSRLTLTFGLFLFDAELDGDLDLLAANGHLQEEISEVRDGVSFRQPAQLFLNQGHGAFQAYRPMAKGVFAQPMVARGAAHGDYDADGDSDVLITENGGPVHLWRNDSRRGHFLRVRLEGRQSNRDGVGARVVAVADGRRVMRRVRAGASYLSASDKVLTFGLGRAAQADSLLVHWPSGHTDRLAGVAAGQTLRIVEGSVSPGRARPSPVAEAAVRKDGS